ncbi:TldD/PmbA family protein [bacterium]|nr:TldD/PmbA family protein [candidate division CSSED10-310 bacterium]
MKALFDSLVKKTDSAELFELDSTVNLIIFESGHLKNLNTLNSKGAAVRAVAGGKLGQAIVSDMRSPGETAERIRKLAEQGDPVSFKFSDAASVPTLNLVDDRIADLGSKEIVELGQEAVEAIKAYDSNVTADFIGERTLDRVRVMTSRGADLHFERLFFSYGISAELIEPQNILRLGKYAKGITPPKTPLETARDVIRDLRIGRNNVSFKPGRMPVLFAPSAMSDVLMAFTGSVDGDLVAKGVSPLSRRMGEQLLDPRISILDDPWHPDGIMSAPFDDEGTPTFRKPLIEKGVLKQFMTDRKSAAALDINPSGNGYRAVPFERYKSFGVGISTEFSNLIIEPGQTQLDRLRAGIRYGIEIHQINGILLGDLIGGDFSGSLEIAYLIENGERTGRVKNAMVAGNFFKIFKDQLVDMSAEQQWSGTFGGCSGSLLLPYILTDGVDISGTD